MDKLSFDKEERGRRERKMNRGLNLTSWTSHRFINQRWTKKKKKEWETDQADKVYPSLPHRTATGRDSRPAIWHMP